MKTQAEKGAAFRALHQREDAFLIPNPWDIGTAKLLAHLAFEALATTSSGYAFSIGRRDNTVDRDEIMAHVAALVGATDLPVSADLENGFGDAPEQMAETIRAAAAAGLAGGSIEDATGRAESPIYEEGFAVERIRAAADAVRALPFPFTLTARAENFLHGRPDLANTIQRLRAYQHAGADVLYAPGLTTEEQISAVVKALDKPVNVLVGLKGMHFTLRDLSKLGVKRASVGGGLCRVAMGAFLHAARQLKDKGNFEFPPEADSLTDLSTKFTI